MHSSIHVIHVLIFLQYEHTRDSSVVSQAERSYRVRVRSNITRALTALDLTTVNDIQQTSAALAQCTVSRDEGRRERQRKGKENETNEKSKDGS